MSPKIKSRPVKKSRSKRNAWQEREMMAGLRFKGLRSGQKIHCTKERKEALMRLYLEPEPIELDCDYSDPKTIFWIRNMRTREMNQYNAIVALASVNKTGPARANLETAMRKANEMTTEQVAFMADMVDRVQYSPYDLKMRDVDGEQKMCGKDLKAKEDIIQLFEDMSADKMGKVVGAIMNSEALEKLKKVFPSSLPSEMPEEGQKQIQSSETCGTVTSAPAEASQPSDTAGETLTVAQ